MNEQQMPVTVQILDKDYRIICSREEQAGLMDCARMLDQRMREVRQNGRVIGADRIAVMAALNLLYETMQQGGQGGIDVNRLQALQERVSAALVSEAEEDKGHAPTAGVDSAGKSV
ncbi:MAG: cell division protein ZapA [Thiohalocapsa sp. PB-PSB1]|jgi:cell division protein ZapA|nr:MAG: hypothetical protein N838_05080 [Thiohalocapsa sp. PB-PSB1]QQO52749.1 MAG: cell division protein ZapA [Thiohalocapsa sp. PB-PSB1]HCS91974.1 cell division protein ZapA [Chromatiaceae bacterium]